MLKTVLLILIKSAWAAQFSISTNSPSAQTTLRDGPTLSCPAAAKAENPDQANPDIEGRHFVLPPLAVRWSSSNQSFRINAATVTAYLPSGERHVCNITSDDVQDSLLPYYWSEPRKQSLDPVDSGKAIPQICNLKCGGFKGNTKGVRFIPATVMVRGYTVGGDKVSEDLMSQASFMITVTH